MARKRATGPRDTRGVRFGRSGRAVPVPKQMIRKSRTEGRALYEDRSLGPKGSRKIRPPRPPRRRGGRES